MYLDNSATTAVSEEVLNEMEPYFREAYGNPSTLYSVGREAKKGLDKARQRVADAINADPKEIIFTSGGSESDNLAIKGICQKYKNYCNFSFIYDRENLLDMKDSPSDKGELIFNQLKEKRVKVK